MDDFSPEKACLFTLGATLLRASLIWPEKKILGINDINTG